MEKKIRDIMILVRMKILNVEQGTYEILSLLGENTEGVSDAQHKSGVLHDVGESHASVENCKSDLASGELPLEKITDDGNDCKHDWQMVKGVHQWKYHCPKCDKWDD